ncbi:MAG TPA: murein biosynthesis integral membrane protein MurJ [Anaerolineae bacterium]|nr:murein biosynthesis integral membrane protein MurJ [Anaerolineae bacterium]
MSCCAFVAGTGIIRPVSQNNPPSLFRAAGTVAFAILFGQVMSLLRSMLFADAFPDLERDAFFAANRVSETLFTLIAAGALGSAFMPTFTGLLVKDKRESAWRLAASLATLVTLTLSLFAVIAAIFAPQIVRYLLAPGFYADPALFNLTVDLLRIQLASAVLFGLGGLLVGVLNAHHVFFIPQLTASVYQLGQIFGILVLAKRFGLGIYGLAWGVVIGSAFYLAIQIPALLGLLRKLPARPSISLGLDNPDVLQVIRLMGPRVLGASVVQLNFWVNNNLASQMGSGFVNTLGFGFALMVMAQAVIAQSVAIAVMPTFSAQFALGKRDEMRAALSSALRGVLLLALPASLGLMLLASPIVSMLYQRGKFEEIAVQMTAWALIWYAAGMIGHSLLEVLTRAFYARQDTKTPVVVGVAAMTLNVLLSFAFSAWFRQIGWMPHGGLALANSLATALEAAVLFILMRRQLDGVQGRSIADGLLRFGLSALGMGLALAAWLGFSAGMNPWLVGLGGVAIGGAVYGVLLIILRVSEVQMILRIIKSRLPG